MRPQSDGVSMPPPNFGPATPSARMCHGDNDVAMTPSQNEYCMVHHPVKKIAPQHLHP